MLNKDKFGPGQNFYVWPQVEEAPRQQLWLRKRKYKFACILVIYEIGGSKVFSYSGAAGQLIEHYKTVYTWSCGMWVSGAV